jgi:PAS domain S-box-containing protein
MQQADFSHIFQHLVSTSRDGYWIVDRSGRFLDVNDSYCDMCGYSKDELRSMHIWEIDELDNAQQVARKMDKIASSGSLTFTTKHRKKEGASFHVEMTASYIEQDDGLFVAFCRDISDRIKSESQVKRTADLLLRSQAIAHVGSWEYHLVEDTLTWTDEVFRIFGYEPGSLMPTLDFFMQCVHEDDRNYVDRTYRSSVERGDNSYSFEHRIVRPDTGEIRYVHEKCDHVKDSDGQIIRSIGMVQDITDSRIAKEKLRKNEELLKESQRVARLGHYTLNVTSGIWTSSDYLDHLFGINDSFKRDVQGWLQLIHPDDVEDMSEYLTHHVLENHQRFDKEYRIVNHKTGTTIWVHGLGDLKLGRDNNPIEMIGTIQDITERRESESEIIRLEAMQRAMISNISDVIGILEPDGTIRYKSGNIEPIFKWKPQELIGRPAWDTVHENEIPRLKMIFTDLLKQPRNRTTLEFTYKRGDGEYVPVESTATNLVDDPQIQGVLLNYRDISERKQQEEELRQSEARFKALHNASFGGIAIHDQGRILECNQGLSDITGFSYDELIGMDGLNLISDSTRDKVLENIQRGYEKPYDVLGVRKNGEEYPLRLEARNIPYRGHEVRVVEFRDITKEKQDEVALRESEEHTRSILKAIPDILFEFDNLGTYLYVYAPDPERLLFPEEEFINRVVDDVMPEDMARMTHDVIFQTLKLRIPIEFGYQLDMDGEPGYYEGRMVPKGNSRTLLVLRDVSEQAKLEQERARLEHELLHAQKMDTVGRLAGGVAHDFNNMLGVIIGNIELIRSGVISEWETSTELAQIEHAATRSADLTRQLLAFARKQTITPQILSLNDTISGMLKMLQRLIGENIDLVWSPASSLWPVKIDPSQVDQVLTNLLVNARDAIDGIGEIRIETENVEVDAGYSRANPGLTPGRYTMFSVSDNGCGMDESVKTMLFEPFYTTKPQGEGTGLGLATVYGIVQQNNGYISVQSEKDKGSVFRIYLPMVKTEDVIRQHTGKGTIPGGSEKILLVEDEEALLTLTKKMLEHLGYTVYATTSPGEALELSRSLGQELNLLLTDVMMPDMDGRELADHLLQIHPYLRVLFMSGYTSTIITRNSDLIEYGSFLQKPFTRRHLAETVRLVLDQD